MIASKCFSRSVCRQQGVATLAVGILLLLLITLVTLYGARVGLMEQRISGNEYRAKLVHAAAETGISHGLEYLNSNLLVFNSEDPVLMPDGSEQDGWLSPTDYWRPGVVDIDNCDPANVDTEEEKIACDSGLFGKLYFYDATPGGSADKTEKDVFGAGELAPLNSSRQDDELRVGYAVDYVMCPLNVADHDNDPDTPPSLPDPTSGDPPCSTDSSALTDSHFYALLVVSEGFIVDEAGTKVEASPKEEIRTIAVKYNLAGSGPNTPLTVAGSFTGGGTFDIVANPNGGPALAGNARSGVPISVWSGQPYDSKGSSVTCQHYEFFARGTEGPFRDEAPYNNYTVCSDCTCPPKSQPFYFLSGGDEGNNIDIVDDDPNFPDDPFQYLFGVPKENHEVVKELAEVMADCSTLDWESSGLIWVTGSCSINANSIVGNPHEPILLISEGDITLNGGAELYGVIYAFSSSLSLAGGSQVWGAVMSDDADISGSGGGSKTIIYDREVLDRLGLDPDLQRLSTLPGTWSDRTIDR